MNFPHRIPTALKKAQQNTKAHKFPTALISKFQSIEVNDSTRTRSGARLLGARGGLGE